MADIEKYNQMEIERTRNSLELARSKTEQGMAELGPLVLKAIQDGLVDTDINVRLKAAVLYLERVVPKVQVRSTEADAEVVESEAKKVSRNEIEELMKKKGMM